MSFKRIKQILTFVAMSLAFASFGASAEGVTVPTDCKLAFDDQSNPIKGSFHVCNRDIALNTFFVAMGAVINDSESLKGVFAYFDIPVPNSTPRSLRASTPLLGLSYAVVAIGTMMMIAALGYRFFSGGYSAMRDASIEAMVRDPDVWKSGGIMAAAAFLFVPVGSVIVGQVIVVGAVLASLKISTYMLSGVLAVFSSQVTSNGTYDISSEIAKGRAFGDALVTSVTGAQNNALILNFMNIKSEDARLVREGGTWSFWSDTSIEEKDPDINEYIKGLLQDTLISVRQTAVTQLDRNRNMASPKVLDKTTSSLAMYRNLITDDGKIVWSPLFEQEVEFKDVFSYPNIINIDASIPEGITQENIKSIQESKSYAQLKEAMKLAAEATDQDNILSDEVIKSTALAMYTDAAAIAKTNDKIESKDVLVMYQKMAMGIVRDTGSFASGSVANINPLSFPIKEHSNVKMFSPTTNTWHWYVERAIVASNHMRAYECTKNLSSYPENFYFMHEYKKGDNSKLAKQLFSPSFIPQCMTIGEDGAPSLLIDDNLKGNILKVIEAIESGAAPDIKFVERLNAFEGDEDVIASLEKSLSLAHAEINKISNSHSAALAIGKYAAFHSMGDKSKDDSDQQIVNLRVQGPMALASYFMALSQSQGAYSAIITDAQSPVAISSTIDPNNTHSSVNELTENNKVRYGLFRFESGAYSAGLNASSSAGSYFLSGGDRASAINKESERLTDYLLDLAIPNDNILKTGFGFSDDHALSTSLENCAYNENCVNFDQHPLATLSVFGKSMMNRGILIKSIDMGVQFAVSIAGDMLAGNIINDGKKSLLSGVKGVVGGLITAVANWTGAGIAVVLLIKSLGFISGMISAVASIYILAGAFLGYIMPFMPLIAQFIMWLGWIAEAFLMFFFVPLLLPLLVFQGVDGKPILKIQSIISMYCSVLLRGPMVLVSFFMFYSLSYGMAFAVNSMIFNTTNFSLGANSDDVGMLMELVGYVSMFALMIMLYFVGFKALVDMMTKMPDSGLKAINIQGLSGSVSSGFEQFLKAKAVQGGIENILGRGGESLKAPTLEKERNKAAREGVAQYKEGLKKEMDKNNIDYSKTSLADGGGSGGNDLAPPAANPKASGKPSSGGEKPANKPDNNESKGPAANNANSNGGANKASQPSKTDGKGNKQGGSSDKDDEFDPSKY